MSILLASWLKYEKGERVIAYDFESPESRMMNRRNQDLDLLKNGAPTLSRFVGENTDFYPMGAIKAKETGYSMQDLQNIATNIRKAKQTGEGYIICDFPGRFINKEAVFTLVQENLVDLIVFPLQPEQQSITSMFVVNKFLREPGFIKNGGDQKILCFWNMVSRNDRRGNQDVCSGYENILTSMNIPISTTRINYVDSVKRPPTYQSMVTTTVCYPRLNMLKAFPPLDGQNKPYIENLFEEIKSLVDVI